MRFSQIAGIADRFEEKFKVSKVILKCGDPHSVMPKAKLDEVEIYGYYDGHYFKVTSTDFIGSGNVDSQLAYEMMSEIRRRVDRPDGSMQKFKLEVTKAPLFGEEVIVTHHQL